MRIWAVYAIPKNEDCDITWYFLDKEDAWKYLRSVHEEKNKPLEFNIYPIEVNESKE
jgi:hypothetical protein